MVDQSHQELNNQQQDQRREVDPTQQGDDPPNRREKGPCQLFQRRSNRSIRVDPGKNGLKNGCCHQHDQQPPDESQNRGEQNRAEGRGFVDPIQRTKQQKLDQQKDKRNQKRSQRARPVDRSRRADQSSEGLNQPVGQCGRKHQQRIAWMHIGPPGPNPQNARAGEYTADRFNDEPDRAREHDLILSENRGRHGLTTQPLKPTDGRSGRGITVATGQGRGPVGKGQSPETDRTDWSATGAGAILVFGTSAGLSTATTRPTPLARWEDLALCPAARAGFDACAWATRVVRVLRGTGAIAAVGLACTGDKGMLRRAADGLATTAGASVAAA